MTEAEARAQLARDTAASTPPVLTDDDLQSLLDQARRVDRYAYLPDTLHGWAAQTAYALAAEAVPLVRNGHYYVVSVAGTSGATEPTWPTTTDGTVDDGTVTWQEAGRAYWTPTWDLNWATAEGWLLKQGRVSNAYNISDTGQSLSRSDLFTHMQAMEKRYRRRVLGEIVVTGRAYRPALYPNAYLYPPSQVPNP
jgi:hypothetical protein